MREAVLQRNAALPCQGEELRSCNDNSGYSGRTRVMQSAGWVTLFVLTEIYL